MTTLTAPTLFTPSQINKTAYSLNSQAPKFSGSLSTPADVVSLKFGKTVDLTPAEAAAINEFNTKKAAQPENIIFFTDPGRDPDDVAAMEMFGALKSSGHANLLASICTHGEDAIRLQRAQLNKGVLNEFGLGDTPVAVGGSYAYPADAKVLGDHNKLLKPDAAHLMADASTVRTDAQQVLLESLEAAPDKSVTLLAIAGQTDVAELVASQPELVQQKVKQVVVMGGAKTDASGKVELDADGFVQADTVAYNNTANQTAANQLFRQTQELGITLKLLNRDAAAAAATNPGFYDGAAETGNDVAAYLKKIAIGSLNGLYNNLLKGAIPGRDVKWFFSFFTDRKIDDAEQAAIMSEQRPFDTVKPEISKLNLYDPMTLLACFDATNGTLFAPSTINQDGKSSVELIGKNEVINADKARALMAGLAKQGCNVAE